MNRLKHRRAGDPLDDRHASAVFDFSDDDIVRTAGEAGLELLRIEHRPPN